MSQDLFGICPYVTAQQVLRGKWSIVVLHQLEDGPVRFNELQRRLPDMTHATPVSYTHLTLPTKA